MIATTSALTYSLPLTHFTLHPESYKFHRFHQHHFSPTFWALPRVPSRCGPLTRVPLPAKNNPTPTLYSAGRPVTRRRTRIHYRVSPSHSYFRALTRTRPPRTTARLTRVHPVLDIPRIHQPSCVRERTLTRRYSPNISVAVTPPMDRRYLLINFTIAVNSRINSTVAVTMPILPLPIIYGLPVLGGQTTI